MSFRYNDEQSERFDITDRDTIQQRTREAMHLQRIAGNPFDAEDIAMFEVFDREGFSPERCRAYILEQLEKRKDDAPNQSVPEPDTLYFAVANDTP